MATWPTTLPAPQKSISITPGDTRKKRRLQSGRHEYRRHGDGKPDQAKVFFRLTWAQWDIFKEYHARDLNQGVNWFSADWLASLGYSDHKAKILGYPSEVVRQGYYVDIFCVLLVQKTIWTCADTGWPYIRTYYPFPPPEDPSIPPLVSGYVYGGNSGVSFLQDCDQYTLDEWTAKSDMPLPERYLLVASTIGSFGYVYGGWDITDCDRYAPTSDTWASMTDIIPPMRYLHAASTIGSSGYIYGGYSSSRLQDCDQYTPDVWTAKSDMPAPARHALAASTIGNFSYVYGGYTVQDCDQYTPTSDTWASMTNVISPIRYHHAAFTIEYSGYISGGGGYSSSVLQDCDQYTPDTWTAKSDVPLPTRSGHAASTIGNSGYIYGGGYDVTKFQDCDQYTPDTWTAKSDMLIPARSFLSASTI